MSGRPRGEWFAKALKALPDYIASSDKTERGSFIANLSSALSQAPNTTWRQLRALHFLKERGVDLAAVAGSSSPPAMLSIERVAKVYMTDAMAGAKLLAELIEGKHSVHYFLTQTKTGAEDFESRRMFRAPMVTLDRVITRHFEELWFSRHPDGLERIRTSVEQQDFPFIIWVFDRLASPGDRKIYLPIFRFGISESERGGCAIIVDSDHALARLPNFEMLIEGAIFEQIWDSAKIIVYSNIELPRVEASIASMGRRFGDRISVQLSWEKVEFGYEVFSSSGYYKRYSDYKKYLHSLFPGPGFAFR